MKPESKALEDVRRWRKQVYDDLSKQPLAQRIEKEQRLAAALGLRVVDERDLVKPEVPGPARKAG